LITFQLNDQLAELATSPPIAELREHGSNEVERRASRALQWWERSFVATDPMIKIVFLFTALEAILGNNSEGIKSEDLAMHRAALSEALNEGFSTPHVTARKLPPRIARNRVEQAARDAADGARLRQPISAHVAARRIALDLLTSTHQGLADGSDLDLTGSTRPAAVWQMAGRCLGIARALICLLEQGFTAEVLHLGRALHEATRLLSALGDREEDALLRKWLAGEYISPGSVRAAEERYEQRLAAAMAAEGRSERRGPGPSPNRSTRRCPRLGTISALPLRATSLRYSERWWPAPTRLGSAGQRRPS
jgi:hypothetical protein